ncbi:MAG: CopD family protein, partial [Pseudomonadota bacterium]|nr:CopD family protein [Pseudomonadota bacterium]
HGLLARHRRLFADDQNRQSARYFRILNEVPTVLLIGIIILVIVRPF